MTAPRFHFDPRRAGPPACRTAIAEALSASLIDTLGGRALAEISRTRSLLGASLVDEAVQDEMAASTSLVVRLSAEFSFDPLAHDEAGGLLRASCAARVLARLAAERGEHAGEIRGMADRMEELARRGIQAMAVEALARGAIRDSSPVDICALVADEVDPEALALMRV